MKTSRWVWSVVVLICAMILFSLHAQQEEISQAQIAEDLAIMQLLGQPLAAEAIPQSGTFFMLKEGVDDYPPLPFNPFPDLPVYSYGTNHQFVVDDRTVDYQAIEEDQQLEKALMQAFGLSEEAEGGGGMMGMGLTFTNGLWLSIEQLTNGIAPLILHGTTGGFPYLLTSRIILTQTNWTIEQIVVGASNQDWTPISVPVGERTNTLFFNAVSLVDSDNDGMPDFWELSNSLNPDDASDANSDPDGDGFSNQEEYI